MINVTYWAHETQSLLISHCSAFVIFHLSTNTSCCWAAGASAHCVTLYTSSSLRLVIRYSTVTLISWQHAVIWTVTSSVHIPYHVINYFSFPLSFTIIKSAKLLIIINRLYCKIFKAGRDTLRLFNLKINYF